MKITVIGPGSMGLLFGGRLAACADVTLIGNNPRNLDLIARQGVTIKRDGESVTRKVKVLASGEAREPADLVLLFTKAYQIRDVLNTDRKLIGPDTVLMTLQNGAGHDAILREFTDISHIVIGTTKQGSYREDGATIVNSGLGETVFGCPVLAGENGQAKEIGMDADRLEMIRRVFEDAGFPAFLSENIRFDVWNKLMINASSSVLSGILQVRQGYVAENEEAWAVCKDLIREICMTAEGEGCHFDPEEQILRIQEHLRNAPYGYTSIYADLKNGRKTEADFICGAVVKSASAQGMTVPVQTTILNLVHAMEGRSEKWF